MPGVPSWVAGALIGDEGEVEEAHALARDVGAEGRVEARVDAAGAKRAGPARRLSHRARCRPRQFPRSHQAGGSRADHGDTRWYRRPTKVFKLVWSLLLSSLR
jgi:hypothetical protein